MKTLLPVLAMLVALVSARAQEIHIGDRGQDFCVVGPVQQLMDAQTEVLWSIHSCT